ncbi:MAG: hypothetical protein HC831_28715 [Chloroflexia bacterium]|nr:hypothetical protein [Chloroflexia bacterium]
MNSYVVGQQNIKRWNNRRGSRFAYIAAFHKHSDSTGKRAVKSGALGAAGYFLGAFAEKKFKEKKKE